MKLHYDALQKSQSILQQRHTGFVPEKENQPSAETCVPKNNPMIPKCVMTMMEIINKQCAVFARLFHYSLIGCVLSFKISTESSRTQKITITNLQGLCQTSETSSKYTFSLHFYSTKYRPLHVSSYVHFSVTMKGRKNRRHDQRHVRDC